MQRDQWNIAMLKVPNFWVFLGFDSGTEPFVGFWHGPGIKLRVVHNNFCSKWLVLVWVRMNHHALASTGARVPYLRLFLEAAAAAVLVSPLPPLKTTENPSFGTLGFQI
eukprot:4209328-Amphidinium_carterae.1